MNKTILSFFASLSIFLTVTSLPAAAVAWPGLCVRILGAGLRFKLGGTRIPKGDSLLKVSSKNIIADSPTDLDYQATVNSNAFQIIRNLPPIQDEIPEEYRHKYTILVERNAMGVWQIKRAFGDLDMPSSIQARLETDFKKARSILNLKTNEGFAEIRQGYRSGEAESFHRDDPIGAPTVVDTWRGARTYFQGVTNNVFQVQSDEAVVSTAAIHAAPPAYEQDESRIFVRMTFPN